MIESLAISQSPNPQIAILSLNRPSKRNALNVEMLQQLTHGIDVFSREPGRRVLILAAHGPAFCAGLDLAEAQDPQVARRSAESLARLYRVLAESPLVTIAAAQGAVMGGGAGLLSACDFALAADDLQLAFPEIQRGLAPALVSCVLRRHLSDRQLRELFFLGHPIDATRAEQLGLVNQVVPPDRLLPTALELAQGVCRGAPTAIARTKRLLDALSPRTLAEDLALALQHHLDSRSSAEATEGLLAFRQRRAPSWPPRENSHGDR